MTIDTIKSITVGLISLPSRPQHHEALLSAALTSALAAYSAAHPLLLASSVSATGTAASDEQGAYTQFDIPLSSGILGAAYITISDEQYKHRIVSAGAVNAAARVYGEFSGAQTLTIWRPQTHSAAQTTWQAHHEFIIALLCASFYLTAVALHEADARRAELTHTIANTYYDRAIATNS